MCESRATGATFSGQASSPAELMLVEEVKQFDSQLP